MPNKQYETREVTHGNEWSAFAGFTVKDGVITFDDPTVLTGLQETSFDESQDSSPIYADNQVHITVQGNIKTEGSLKYLQLTKKWLTDHLGKKVLANGGLKDNPTKKNFAYMFQEIVTDEFGGTKRSLTIYYNLQAGAIKSATKGDEDKVEAKVFEIPVTANPNNYVLDADGIPTTYMQIIESEETKTLFNTAYEQVVLPTTTVPATPPQETDITV